MYRRRVLLFFLSLSLPVVFLAMPRGQSAVTAARDYVVGLGLPGIDRGVVSDESRVPGSQEALTRSQGLESRAVVPDRIGPAGSRIVAGRLIVKFREGVSSGERQTAVSSASPGAA